MSKYPYVLLLRPVPSEIDKFVMDNNSKLNCTVFLINQESQSNLLFNNNYQVLIIYKMDYTPSIERFKLRTIHLNELPGIDQFNDLVNKLLIKNCVIPRIQVRPSFSIFTTTYNSYKKIYRAWNSLQKQVFRDFEWVIIDDSPDSKHFDFLIDTFKNVHNIRLYRRSENSGNIGNVKNEAVSLCRGKYVLELDHDDEILPDCLKDSWNYFESHPDVGFIYMDFINIYEDSTNFMYSDFICKGYGSYYSQKYNDKWVYVYNTPNINNITMSHLVCCPNHPRIWNREVLLKIGNYSEFLPICDDYEVLLRTFLNTKRAKIPKVGYIQYMNEGNNNFSLIRNSEINRIGPGYIFPGFYSEFNIHEYSKEIDSYENKDYMFFHSVIWNREDYVNKRANDVYNPDYSMQYCILTLDSLKSNLDLILREYSNNENDFILLDSIPIQELFDFLDSNELTRFKCYSLKGYSPEQLKNYFLVTYLSTKNHLIIT